MTRMPPKNPFADFQIPTQGNALTQLTPNQPKAPPLLPSIKHLLFEAPLYSRYSLGEDLEHYSWLYGRATNQSGNHFTPTLDGHCRDCQSSATFSITGIGIPNGDPWTTIKIRRAFDQMEINCTRNDHVVRYFFYVNRGTVMKVGQWPSLADIAVDETRQKYKRVLKGDNWSELHKAIGLSAHGEGIGAFVYLRRVFERLIKSRFEAFKASENWKEEAFVGLRMEDKIAFLKSHLPAVLVENRKIYSILSVGVHELDNEDCLKFYDVGLGAILMILEDDLKTLDELARREELKKAIAKYQPPS